MNSTGVYNSPADDVQAEVDMQRVKVNCHVEMLAANIQQHHTFDCRVLWVALQHVRQLKWRVLQVYRLNSEGTWDDKGTGLITLQHLEVSPE